MTFSEYPYQRPDMEAFTTAFTTAIDTFKNADTADVQETAMDTIHQLRFNFDTMQSLASIRHSIDTKDEFYDQEKDFFDENGPLFEQLNHRYYQALAAARFKDELTTRKGSLLFDIAEQALRTFNDAILEDLKKENRLISRYDKLIAGAEIEFEGEVRNLTQMSPFMQKPDRDVRRRASRAVSAWFASQEETLDDIYDELVQVRSQIAKTLGYDNFTNLAYDRLGRLDYGPEDVATYRRQVRDNLVPLASELVKRQGNRLGIDTMMSYDLPFEFKTGNPKPKGNKTWMIEKAKTMYQAMSPETDEFFRYMLARELMDLDVKKGKMGGGYCTYIPNHESPFIFANFNGTKHDVDVLTHEAGHAFQVFRSRHHDVPEYMWATLEASEIHSMSMEFFAWPWIDAFFENDTEKYKFSHLAGALMFIPYGVAVDEFQHRIYEKPSMTKEERKLTWREIEKTYLPYKKYDDDNFMERGGFWFRQGHIFAVPFYYIDYTLAQVCAFEYWIKAQEDRTEAWKSYLRLCDAGGSRSFVGLLDLAGLKNPFEPGTIATMVQPLKSFLDSIDDTKL